ncbi:MAG: ATP-binding protein [Mycoplasmataceae bacterium]|nr:ATP-binding protein [Mycoplasmataceae bacterium]
MNKLEKEKIRLIQDLPSFKRVGYYKVRKHLEEGYSPILFGLRRTGKTTILKQLMKDTENSIYITFRNSYINKFNREEIIELVEYIYDCGYRSIYFDEVQIFKDWSEMLVELIDSFPKLNIVVTGSSSLNLELKESGLDRTIKINIQTLSFGEYLGITSKNKSKESFEQFLGNGGFPKYALLEGNNYEIQRSEIYDDIISNDIPAESKNIDISILSRLVSELVKLTNGEVNVKSLTSKISNNFVQRDVLRYMDILEKSKIIKMVKRINADGSYTKRTKFKTYINPHIHLWLLETQFSNLEPKAKGHIIESYWLFWALSINSYGKTFYYVKDASGHEIDFASLNPSSEGPRFKTLHEFKYTMSNKFNLDLLKNTPSINKIIWTLEGEDAKGITGKSILDTSDNHINFE